MAVNLNDLPLSRLIGGAVLEPNAFWPPTGQICGAHLGSGGAVPKRVPQAYLDGCAACHGPDGSGANGLPGIKAARSYDNFAALVRAGVAQPKLQKGEMPAFPASWLNEPDLRRIYAWATGALLLETGACTPRSLMSEGAIEDAYAAGLVRWRQKDGKRDPDGVKSDVACTQCHAADPLDIAYYGFNDGDILRRGMQHLPAAEVAPIVEMVHALRDKYRIGRRDPLVSRPFQPGGALLPGASIAERDAAFGAQLVQMKLHVATRPITTVEEAELAYAQLANVDLHMLRIPVPFNHYSEDINHNANAGPIDCNADVDNCRDHGSIADWIPSSPHTSPNPQQQLAAMDAYLAEPNATTFARYRSMVPGQEAMAGTFAPDTWRIDHSKYRAQVLANYCLQLEVRGQPGCYDQGVAPFPHQADIWDVGGAANLWGSGYAKWPTCDTKWTGCDTRPEPNLPQWPKHMLDDLTPGATLSSNFSRLRHPWMTLWWVHFDPTLLVTGDPTAQKDEYFTRSLFWANLNDWQFSSTPQIQARPAYASFAAWQVMMHNVAVLENPKLSSCNVYPAIDFTCTAVDLRSGYFPNLINFAEQNQAQNPEKSNNINYQVRFSPTEPVARANYQMLTANMYRMFFYRLIGKLQQDNWMCNVDLPRLRMARAKSFFDQAETQSGNAAADAAMLKRLDMLLAGARKDCPPL